VISLLREGTAGCFPECSGRRFGVFWASFWFVIVGTGEVSLKAIVTGGQKARKSDALLKEGGANCVPRFRRMNCIARANRCESLRMCNKTIWSGSDCHDLTREAFRRDQNRNTFLYSVHLSWGRNQIGNRTQLGFSPLICQTPQRIEG
jgi:hypothetical protein